MADLEAEIIYALLAREGDAPAHRHKVVHVKTTEELESAIRQVRKRRRLAQNPAADDQHMTLRFESDRTVVLNVNGDAFQGSLLPAQRGQDSFECVRQPADATDPELVAIGAIRQKLAFKARLTTQLAAKTKQHTDKPRVVTMTKEVDPSASRKTSSTRKTIKHTSTTIKSRVAALEGRSTVRAESVIKTNERLSKGTKRLLETASSRQSSIKRSAVAGVNHVGAKSPVPSASTAPAAPTVAAAVSQRPPVASSTKQTARQAPPRRPNNVALRDWVIHVMAVKPVDKTQISSKFSGSSSSELRKLLTSVCSVRMNRYRLNPHLYKELLTSPLLAMYSEEDWAGVLDHAEKAGVTRETLVAKRTKLAAVKKGTSANGESKAARNGGATGANTAAKAGSITSEKEFQLRRQEFDAKYQEYRNLITLIDNMAKEFTELGLRVKQLKPGTDERRRAEQQLRTQYEAKHQDYENKQLTYQKLHEELATLKKRIKAYQAAAS